MTGALVFVVTFLILATAAALRAQLSGERFDLRILGFVAAAGIGLVGFAGIVVSPSIAIAVAYAAVSVVTDLSSGHIYDVVTYPAAVGVCVCAIAGGSLATAVCGSAVALSVAGGLHLLTRRRGLGMGDVKLFAVICGALAAEPALVLIGASFICGGIFVGCALLLRRMKFGQRVPFAPYVALATAGLIVLRGNP
jgi:prepilin signal peptidase PulO-like enzyme (type II secretory pathway)